MDQTRFLKVAVAGALLLAAALFAVGTALERSGGDVHAQPAMEMPHEEGAEGHAEEGAGSEETDGSDERVLGIDLESPPLVALGVAISALLAAAVILIRSVAALGIAVAFAVTFAVFDVAEVVHQLGENRGGLAALAALIAVLHAAAAGAGLVVLGRARRAPQIA